MSKWFGLRARLSMTGFAVAVAAALVAVPAAAVTGAGFTTVNEGVDGTGHCQNGNPAINCNIYDGKDFVWLNGGPSVAYVGDGTYFFAVLVPGGQADPNDGGAKNLSDDFDAYTNRIFSVSSATVSYGGSHDFDSNKIRLMPYADTTNNGGVYIMSICSLANGYPAKPSSCKYDAFKVQSEQAPPATDLVVTKDANPSYTRTFTWGITKDVDKTRVDQSGTSAVFNYTVKVTHSSGTDSDWQVNGTISVFNPNADPVSGVDVTDAVDNGGICAVSGGTGLTIAGFGTENVSYSCTYSSEPSPSSGTNTATAAWTPSDANLPGTSGTASFSIGFSFGTPTTLVDNCVTVTDTLGGALGNVCSTDPSPTTFTYSNTVVGTPGTCVSQDNTATFTSDTSPTTDSASQTVTLCVGADLTVEKTATPSFTRTYNWHLSKNVDKTLVEQLGGGTATFNYTVTANQTGLTDSGWQVKGTITVTNPNDWEAVTVNVTDAVDNGGSCAVSGGTNVSVPKSDSITLNYTCSYAAAPSSSAGTNTATAAWDKTAASTPDGSASGQASFAFNDGSAGNPTRVNQNITVTDTFNGVTTTLGTLTATDSSPFASATYTYPHTVRVPQFNCVRFTNTAVIVETGQSGSQTVEICGPARTGALTIGFWQNKNGQAIINGGSSTAGVCNSGTWLRGYAPFQDLSATANCASVAAYVTNVIKAALCTSTTNTCNSMLKAQMLATALDVYFSDPALGGNQIGAPGPIGGVTIDLQHVCTIITGTGACGGGIIDVSSAFSGPSLSVLQILSYAGSQSNVGGSTWYANVKATQVLAKDAFDAINNQVAFAP